MRLVDFGRYLVVDYEHSFFRVLTFISPVFLVDFLRDLVVMEFAYYQVDRTDPYKKFGRVTLGLLELLGPNWCS